MAQRIKALRIIFRDDKREESENDLSVPACLSPTVTFEWYPFCGSWNLPKSVSGWSNADFHLGGSIVTFQRFCRSKSLLSLCNPRCSAIFKTFTSTCKTERNVCRSREAADFAKFHQFVHGFSENFSAFYKKHIKRVNPQCCPISNKSYKKCEEITCSIF